MLKFFSDSEFEQSILRLMIGCIIALYLLMTIPIQTWWTIPFLAFALMSLSLIILVYFKPGNYWWRRIAGQFIDFGTISYALYYGGETTLPAIGVYLWVILGNGFRFGFPYLLSAIMLSTFCISYIAHTQPFWIQNKPWAQGLGISFIIVPIYFAVLLNRLNKAKQTLEIISQHDDLTGLLNRRAFDARIASEFSRLKRYPAPFTLALLDLDNFKSINDNHGHLIGDKVLQAVSQTLKQTCRDIDILSRYGGDELALLLPGYYKNEDASLGDRLRQAVEKSVITTGEFTIQVTISMGLAYWTDQYENVEDWINDADKSRYRATQQGRNKALIATS